MDRPNLALTIAGSDPSGGAGLQADLSVFSRHGLRGAGVLTALTVQSGAGVRRSVPLEAALVVEQLEAVLEDHRVAAAKVGMLGAGETAEGLAKLWQRAGRGIPLVLDPVLLSSSGTPLLEPGGLELLREHLLPLATVVTPNLPEAAALLGEDDLAPEDAVEAGRELLRLGPRLVLITGGHAPGGGPVTDTAVFASGEVHELTGPRLATSHSHGTGCLLSAGLASALALGAPLRAAAEHGRACVARGLEQGREGAVWLDEAPAPCWSSA